MRNVSTDLKVGGRTASLPSGVRIYAVGDIHGRLDLLDILLGKIRDDLAARPIERPVYVFLGDYLDRGPASRGTIDRLVRHSETSESVFLKGNHEAIAIKCLSDRSVFDYWMRLGGAETMMSYGISPKPSPDEKQIVMLQAAFHAALPQSHLRFFRDLRTSYSCGDFFFAHAGVRPATPLPEQKEADLLWIREDFISSTADFGKIVVHGHTPVREADIRPNRVNIDTGAFATGRLTCLVVEHSSLALIDTASSART